MQRVGEQNQTRGEKRRGEEEMGARGEEKRPDEGRTVLERDAVAMRPEEKLKRMGALSLWSLKMSRWKEEER